MVGVSKESGRSFCTLTPASAAVHMLAICVRKCELANMHTNGQRVRCRLHAIVKCNHSDTRLKYSLYAENIDPDRNNSSFTKASFTVSDSPKTLLYLIFAEALPQETNS